MKAIDFFCGCGGIAAGLREAGVDVVAGIDIEEKYACTFKYNFPSAKTLELDLSAVSPEEIARRIDFDTEQLDIIAGGPPCQGFSKNVPRKHRYLEDDNNLLVKAFISNCEYFLPKIIIMENVAEMKNGFNQAYTDEVVERLSNAGYAVSYAVLNAADFGVPQRRRRAFFLARRDGTEPSFPQPTHKKPAKSDDLFTLPNHVSVWDAIGDLPNLEHGSGEELSEYKTEPFSDFQKQVRNGKNVVENHIARKLRPTQYERLAALKPGQGLKDLPSHLQVKGGYSGAYGRLTKEMVAPTITRWVFHPGSGRWGHPEDTRLITIREAARIQGFEDSYGFVGSYTQQAGQIGNAVPPLLIKKLALHLIGQRSRI